MKQCNNIDYLFALTKTLEKDYKEILKNKSSETLSQEELEKIEEKLQ